MRNINSTTLLSIAVGMLIGSLVGLMPFHRLLLLSISIGILVGAIVKIARE